MATAVVIGWLSVVIGLTVSYHADTAASASVAGTAVAIFFVVLAVTEVARLASAGGRAPARRGLTVQAQDAQVPMTSRRCAAARKPVPVDGALERGLEAALHLRRDREVVDPAARRADQVVVVAHEVLGELEARALVARHDAVGDAALLEHDEVAVGRALGERRAPAARSSGIVSGRGASASSSTSRRRPDV